MRSYVGIAIDAEPFEEDSDEFLGLEVGGFREVELGEAKLTLMLLRWAPDGSPLASFFRGVIEGRYESEDESD